MAMVTYTLLEEGEMPGSVNRGAEALDRIAPGWARCVRFRGHSYLVEIAIGAIKVLQGEHAAEAAPWIADYMGQLYQALWGTDSPDDDTLRAIGLLRPYMPMPRNVSAQQRKALRDQQYAAARAQMDAWMQVIGARGGDVTYHPKAGINHAPA
jgi:hypothetical protein